MFYNSSLPEEKRIDALIDRWIDGDESVGGTEGSECRKGTVPEVKLKEKGEKLKDKEKERGKGRRNVG